MSEPDIVPAPAYCLQSLTLVSEAYGFTPPLLRVQIQRRRPWIL